jgi:hypothetical protein
MFAFDNSVINTLKKSLLDVGFLLKGQHRDVKDNDNNGNKGVVDVMAPVIATRLHSNGPSLVFWALFFPCWESFLYWRLLPWLLLLVVEEVDNMHLGRMQISDEFMTLS